MLFGARDIFYPVIFYVIELIHVNLYCIFYLKLKFQLDSPWRTLHTNFQEKQMASRPPDLSACSDHTKSSKS